MVSPCYTSACQQQSACLQQSVNPNLSHLTNTETIAIVSMVWYRYKSESIATLSTNVIMIQTILNRDVYKSN